MRQAGVIAAAGLVALETMVDRLAEDHAHARRLAEGLANLAGLHVDPARVETNIVIGEVRAMPPEQFAAELGARGVLISLMGGPLFRMVTHYGIDRHDIEATLATVAEVLRTAGN